MRNRTKLLPALIAAIALLALATSGASARTLSFSEKNFEFVWNNALTGKTKLTFSDRLNHHFECNVTLLGRHAESTIAKNTAINQGTINHSEVESCANGSVTIRNETMPWNLRYAGFTGTLPTIRTINTNLIGAAFRISESGGLSCTFRSEELEPMGFITEGGSLEDIRADETRTIGLQGTLCGFPTPGHFSGLGLIRNLPRTANITITLI